MKSSKRVKKIVSHYPKTEITYVFFPQMDFKKWEETQKIRYFEFYR